MIPLPGSLDRRLRVVLTTFGVSLVLIMLALLLVVAYTTEQRNLKHHVQTLAHLIAIESQGSMLFADRKLLNHTLATLNSLDEVVRACLYDAQGVIIASLVKPDGVTCGETALMSATHFSVTETIVWKERQLGHLEIVSDSTVTLVQFSKIFGTLIIVVILMIIVIILFSRIFARRETEPLRQLTRTAKEMVLRDEKQLLAVEGFQEIRSLASAFNEVINDLTESRQKAELEVKQKQQAQLKEQQSLHLLADLIDTVPYLIFAYHRDKTVLFANKAVATQYQTSVEKIISGSFFKEYSGKTPDCLLFSQFGEADSEQLFLDPSGDARRFTIARVPFESGRAELVVAIDTTEQHRLQAQLQFSQRLEVVGTLAGGIAHDFNNLLTPILGYASILQDHAFPDDVKDKLRAMELAATKARDVVQRILSFSRHQNATEKSELYINQVLEDAVELMRASVPSTIQIHLHCEPQLEPINGDAGQIHQVLINLCTNAAQAIDKTRGNIFIRASLREADVSPVGISSICIEVRDDGHGMTAEVVNHVFEPFFTTKTIGEGSGLGLSVVHGIIHNHLGVIQVESEEGVGTTFNVYLPITKDHTTTTEVVVTMPQSFGERILLVDDEPPVLEVTKQLLLKSGYQVVDFLCATEALATFCDNPELFDVVITDNSMPGMTGAEFSVKLKEISPTIPIIMITGFVDKLSGLEAIDHKLMKPLSRKELGAAIQTVLLGSNSTNQVRDIKLP